MITHLLLPHNVLLLHFLMFREKSQERRRLLNLARESILRKWLLEHLPAGGGSRHKDSPCHDAQ